MAIAPSEDFTLEVRTVLSSPGSVTSVNVSGGSTGLVFTGGPVTTTGTITMSSGQLVVANGGTGAATLTGYLKGNGTSPFTAQAVPIPVADGGTGTTTAFTAGSVVFAGAAGVYSQDNANLFWDNATKRLGIGTATPTSPLTVNGNIEIKAGSGGVIKFQDGTTQATTAGGGGTVTSVQVAGGATGLSFTGGPITTSGTITAGGVLNVGFGGTGNSSMGVGYVKGAGGVTPFTVQALPIPASDGGTGTTTAFTQGSALFVTGTTGQYGADATTVYVNAFVTGGSGTSGSPWTGWDTGITWSANTHYKFQTGFYSYATSPNFGKNGIWLEGQSAGQNATPNADGGTVIICTGTGDCFTVNGNSGAANGEFIRIDNITVKTNNAASTGNGFMLKNLVYCVFTNLRARDCGAAGFYLENVQNSTFTKPSLLGVDIAGGIGGTGFASKIPVNGINMTTGGNTTNVFLSPSVELGLVAPAADAITIGSGCFNNTFIGGALQSNKGRALYIAGYANTFMGMDLEANTGTEDILITAGGENNIFQNVRAYSTGVTNSITFTTGAGRANNQVIGGHYYRPIVVTNGTGNSIVGKARYANGIVDTGVATTIDAYDLTTNFPLVVPGVLFSQTADSTTTANTLTTMLGTGVGTLTIPSNILVPGRMVMITLGGYVSTADGGAGTKTLSITLGGTTVATGASGATIATLLNQEWIAECYISTRTSGAGGTVQAGGKWYTQIAANGGSSGVFAASTATTVINTTTAQVIDVKFNNGNAVGAIKTTFAVVKLI